MDKRHYSASYRREVHNDVWVNLQQAIVEQAVLDYRDALNDLKRAKDLHDKRSAQGRCNTFVRWFKSPWGEALCYGNGEYIARKVKEEVLG